MSRGRSGGEGDGANGDAGPNPLESLDDEPVAGGEPAIDKPPVADRAAQREVALFDFPFSVHDPGDRVAADIAGDALLRGEDGVFVDAFLDDRTDEHAGQEDLIGIGEDQAEREGTGCGIDSHVAKLQGAFERVGGLVLEQELDSVLEGSALFEVAVGEAFAKVEGSTFAWTTST